MCLLLPCPVSAEDRPVLRIGDRINRSGSRYDEEREMWLYLEDLLGVDIQYEYMSEEEQLDAYRAGSTSPDNYYVRWGGFDKMPTNWPLLRDNTMHPDGYMIDFATITREYEEAAMTRIFFRRFRREKKSIFTRPWIRHVM